MFLVGSKYIKNSLITRNYQRIGISYQFDGIKFNKKKTWHQALTNFRFACDNNISKVFFRLKLGFRRH